MSIEEIIKKDIKDITEILHIVDDTIIEFINDTEKELLYQVRQLTWVSNSQIIKLKKLGLNVWSICASDTSFTVKISRKIKK